MSNYPGANRRAQWYQDTYGGASMTPNVVVLHTTEGGSWPSYSGGATAPNLTVRANKARKKLEIRQHYPLDRSSRALQNDAGGVETNTLNAIQIELIGSCDRKDGYGEVYWPDAPEWCYRELGHLLATLHALYPAIRLEAPKVWLPYPQSYGNTRARMSGHEWLNFYGVCGHQHVPENDHGDPGDLPIDKILAYAGDADSTVRNDSPEPRRRRKWPLRLFRARRAAQKGLKNPAVKGALRDAYRQIVKITHRWRNR